MKKTLLLLATAFFLSNFSICQTLPTGFSATNIASGWTQPVGAVFTPNGQRLFVWEKGGRVYVCNRNGSGGYDKQATPVINISEEVGDWRDHGLLGFALDPNFSSNGYIYLLYVVDRHHLMNFGTASYNAATNTYFNATISRVTRYQTSTSGGNLVANMGSRNVLVGETRQTGIPLLYESHSIGSLVFAADGSLLISAGDGASYSATDPGSISHTYYAQALTDGIIRPEENVGAFRAQLLNCHDGKLLRIDPATGNGIASNPYYSAAAPRSPKSRVWALGFRNPFRFTIKPGTGSTNPATGDIGEIYIADVGYNTVEELTIINKPGVNCGWPLYEGLTQVNAYFNLTTQNPDEPNPLYNGGSCNQQYFTFKNLLKQATADNITTVYNPCNAAQPIGTSNRYFHQRPALDWLHGQDVARVGIFTGNNAAVATIGTSQSNVTGAPFRGNAAVAGCWYTGTLFPVEYRNTFFQADYGAQWLKSLKVDFTDQVQSVQNFATGFTAIVSIAQNPLDGTLVTVDVGNSTVKRISYGGNQMPVAKPASNKIYGPSLLNVAFTGSNSFDTDGSIASYSWNFGDGNTSMAANPSHNFSAPANTPTRYVVKLTVTDNLGATATDSIAISVNNTPPNVTITSPVKNSLYRIGPDTLYTCAATVTDAEHTPGNLKYAWQSFLRHNNHIHPESIDTTRNTTTMISRIGCNGDSYYWYIQLTVTDAAGLSTVDSSKIFPSCISQGPLPIVLRKFSVTQQGSINMVKWTTEQEENLKFFEVERSTNGIDFVPINQQPARNRLYTNEYSFPDNTFSNGNTYYRLKIIEQDLKNRYSVIVKTFAENAGNGLSIMPNPNRGDFAIGFHSTESGPALIQVRDANGLLVLEKRESVGNGQTVIYITGLEGKPAGLYFISIQHGSRVRIGKFIKE